MPVVTATSHIADGSLRDSLIFRQRIGRSHARRFINVFAYVFVVVLAAHFLNDDAEQQETVVAVTPLAAGLELQTALPVELHVVLQSTKFQALLVEFRSEKV